MENFVFECIDKYFEWFNNTKNILSGSAPSIPTPEISEGFMGVIKKMLPFAIALGVARYPQVVGGMVESVMSGITSEDQPNVIEVQKNLTMEEKIEEAEKNGIPSGGGSTPIPKEQWKQLTTSEPDSA